MTLDPAAFRRLLDVWRTRAKELSVAPPMAFDPRRAAQLYDCARELEAVLSVVPRPGEDDLIERLRQIADISDGPLVPSTCREAADRLAAPRPQEEEK